MTSVSDSMTRDLRDLRAMAPGDCVVLAAQTMDGLNVGAVPVCEGARLVGMVTDRDITVRGVAQRLASPDVKLFEIMSREVHGCSADESVEDVLQNMASHQLRRLPAVDRDQHLVGRLARRHRHQVL